jgi:hypothetical protein
MASRAESEYPTGTEGDATFFTRRILYDDIAVVIRRFPPVDGAPTGGRPFVLVHGIGVSSRYFHPSAAQLARYGPVYFVGHSMGTQVVMFTDPPRVAALIANHVHA